MTTPRRVEVLVRADVTKVVAVAEVKARLGITASTHDAVIGLIVDDLSSQIADYMGRPLAFQRYRETLIGDGETRLLLQRMPVEAGSISLTVDGTAYTDWTLEDGGILYREDGWSEDSEPNIVVTYWAGWLMPGVVSTWAADATKAVGAWVRPSLPSLSPMLFQATVAGETDATEPTWPTTAAETVVDGTVTWSARAVEELPEVVRGVAYLAVKDAFESRMDRSDLRGQQAGFFREDYAASSGVESGVGFLTPRMERVLANLRVAA